MNDDVFPTHAVAGAVGITYRQLDYWLRSGAVACRIDALSGSGSRRGWTVDDVAVVAAVADLVRSGTALHLAAMAVADVDAELRATTDTRPSDLDDLFLVVTGGSGRLVRVAALASVLATAGGPTTVVPCSGILDRIDDTAGSADAAEVARLEHRPR